MGHFRLTIIIFETLVVNFSAYGASIFKISVPIIRRRSRGFQNTPNLQSLYDFDPSYGNSKKILFWEKWRFTCILNQIQDQNCFGNIFFFKLQKLGSRLSNFASWGCFGILRTSSWWWAQRFLKLMHPWLRNWQKRESHF